MTTPSVTPSARSQPRRSPVFSLLFVIIGGYFLFTASQFPILACTRTAAGLDCSLKTSLLGLVTLQQSELNTLQTARLGEACDRRGCTYRVELVHAGVTTPLTSAYSSDREAIEALINQIAGVIANPAAPALSIAQPPNILDVLIPLVFMAAGIAMLFIAPRKPAQAG
jgi:hypothetical protein